VLHALERWDQKNSPTRWHFRPPNQLTFRFRVRPLGSASTYSRSVVGAEGNLADAEASVQDRPDEKRALCDGLLRRALPSGARGLTAQLRGAQSRAHRLLTDSCESAFTSGEELRLPFEGRV